MSAVLRNARTAGIMFSQISQSTIPGSANGHCVSAAAVADVNWPRGSSTLSTQNESLYLGKLNSLIVEGIITVLNANQMNQARQNVNVEGINNKTVLI